jgi:hypothetical protein
MAKRPEITFTYLVIDRGQERRVTMRATETIAVEDCYSVLTKAVLHRYKTNEDVVPVISRDIKDVLIKLNLSI